MNIEHWCTFQIRHNLHFWYIHFEYIYHFCKQKWPVKKSFFKKFLLKSLECLGWSFSLISNSLTPKHSESFSQGKHLEFLQIIPSKQSEFFKQSKSQNPSIQAAGWPQSSSSWHGPCSQMSMLQRRPWTSIIHYVMYTGSVSHLMKLKCTFWKHCRE